MTNVDILRNFNAKSLLEATSNDDVADLYEQRATMAPALQLLSTFLSIFGNASSVVDGNVLYNHIASKYGTDSAVMAVLYDVGQRLQGIPNYQAVLYDINSGMTDFFSFIR